MNSEDDDVAFHAYELNDASTMPLEPAERTRGWMDATPARFAARCLPLNIANQTGWVIRNPIDFSATWSGGPRSEDLTISFADDRADTRVLTHFGHGIITFAIPYLFRTPVGISLWVKGPSNWIKDGVQPLEGIVETDWTITTFTMSWKMTRPDHVVRFERGDPICMITPISCELTERMEPVRMPIGDDPDVAAEYRAWSRGRRAFGDEQHPDGAHAGDWQQDYMRGRDATGIRTARHRTRVRVRPFSAPPPPPPPTEQGTPL